MIGPAKLARVAMASLLAVTAGAAGEEMVQLDPFAQATRGFAACPARTAPLSTAAEARAEAHVRAERGTRCGMDGSCEPGGAYRRDPEINEQVRAALAGETRFADTALWLSTTRRWVFVSGCVRTAPQRRALIAFIRTQPRVERVFDQTQVGAR